MLIEPPITITPREGNIPFKLNPKSQRGIILSLLTKFKKDAEKGINYTPRELYQVFDECLNKYNELKNTKEYVTLELLNWKGRDIIEIYRDLFDEDFILLEHRKDKHSGDVDTITHSISKDNVNRILSFIKTWNIKESKECYEFASILGFEDWKSLWKERKQYFDLYYFPLKVLEKLGVIKYSGRGKVTRLK